MSADSYLILFWNIIELFHLEEWFISPKHEAAFF